jgi:hypothetical protein
MASGLIAKKILALIMRKLLKKYNFDKIKKYVDEPNELDDKVETLESKVALLEKMAHPEKELICKCYKEKESK